MATWHPDQHYESTYKRYRAFNSDMQAAYADSLRVTDSCSARLLPESRVTFAAAQMILVQTYLDADK